ncbi:MaoC family dehydratase [Microvirga sp. VF16]|uniref:MaoC family dehydratase n=1 Tax=Microvirga sp. VF16 TaxID=2807101 RepID=UPI00193E7813|nr:MaoC family dehydratase [Microvirga sp. VF16]QRM29239.1 MaoC family dehydratase [Microvirga sp. VF16]
MQHTIEITQEKIDRYGDINGDYDIIHYDHDYAVQRGFRGTLVHGPHLSAFACDMALQKYGADWFRHGRLRTKWIAPVCPGDDLVVELSEDGAITETVGGAAVVVGSATIEKD